MTNKLGNLGAKPSISEERGLSQISDSDLMIFSPGISTAGFAEIRMARQNKNRKIIATTIDKAGLSFANQTITQFGFQKQIETKLEDIREVDYPDKYFDFIYARLVLHYLTSSDLDIVLYKFHKILKPHGRLFIVVRSAKNVDYHSPDTVFDPITKLTTIVHRNQDGIIDDSSTRYFHTLESMTQHLTLAGFKISTTDEYQEKIYQDFKRQDPSPRDHHLIEITCHI